MKKNKQFPQSKFICVYSDEQIKNQTAKTSDDSKENSAGNISKGSIVQVTGVFGFTLCSLVINDLYNK